MLQGHYGRETLAQNDSNKSTIPSGIFQRCYLTILRVSCNGKYVRAFLYVFLST